jgi:hypothetical protein
MSLYKTFATDEAVEKQGISIDYGDERFLIARAGGSNSAFKKCFAAKIKPYRRQIDQGNIDDSVANRLMAEAYAETVILLWESKAVDEAGVETWVDTISGADGKPMKFSKASCTALLLDLPELFADLQVMAGQASNFRQDELEEDVKN